MQNKTLGTLILVSLGTIILAIIFESAWGVEATDMLAGFAMIALYVFGIWGSIRLINSK